MDHDGPDVFDRTVNWAVDQGIETATFHIMTPYPGTGLHRRWRPKDESCTATGIATTPGTWSSARSG